MKDGKKLSKLSNKSPRKASRRVYLDYASTTPIDKSVLREMKPFLDEHFENPSSLYKEGVENNKIIINARAGVARSLHALPDEIVFTGSGTEADNLAILGVVKASFKLIKKPHIVISAIEHPAIIELQNEIKRMGAMISVVYPKTNGIIEPKEIQKNLRQNTVLVSVMYANNEIGTIQPIKEVSKVIRFYRKQKAKDSQLPYFHTDASQAANYCSLNVSELGVDLLTIDGSKIYGPKGIGVLYIRRNTAIEPIIFGGGQERGMRSGTENLALIVGFAKALDLVNKSRVKESARLTILRDWAIKEILKKFPEATLNGDLKLRLPNNINICFPQLDSEYAVIKADAFGVLISAASSCRTLSENTTSYVLENIGSIECAGSSLRFTLGRDTTMTEIKILLKLLPKIVLNYNF